jgi:hypothetical protein
MKSCCRHTTGQNALRLRAPTRVAGNGGEYRGLIMLRMVAFCRPHLAALALSTAAIAASVMPASARSHHRSGHHAQAYAGHQVRWHHPQYHSRYHHRQVARQSRWGDAAPMPASGYVVVTPGVDNTTRIVRYQSRHSLRRAAQPSRWERQLCRRRPQHGRRNLRKLRPVRIRPRF